MGHSIGNLEEAEQLLGSSKRPIGWLAALQALTYPFDLDRDIHAFVRHNVTLTIVLMISYVIFDWAVWGARQKSRARDQEARVRAFDRKRRGTNKESLDD